MRGASFEGFLADECAQMSREVWAMLNSRLDRPQVRGWATFNPSTPQHWFKTEVLDHAADTWNAEVLHFSFNDNPSLTQETQERFKRQFRGAFAKRMIEGEWTALSGLVYPFWHRPPDELRYVHLKRKQYRIGTPERYIRRIWGLDYGLATTMAVVAARPAVAEPMPGDNYEFRSRWVIDREYYYDARQTGRSRTEDEHLHQLLELIPQRSVLVIDPSTPIPFRARLKQHWTVVLGFNEDVLEGCTRTSALLSNAVLMVDADAAPNLVDELESYRWKEDQDQDQPEKGHDHAADALRYLACFLEYYTRLDVSAAQRYEKRMIGGTRVEHAFVLLDEAADGSIE